MSRLLIGDGYGKRFGSLDVLKSAGVWASSGTITVLFGRNGSGKTTLLRCMMGLTRAEYGALHFDGETHLQPRLARLAKQGLFYLPDRAFLPIRLRFGQMIRLLESARGRHERRGEVLEGLRVQGFEDRRVREMSGGEARRCEWALALLARPICIVADEPFAGITPRDRVAIGEVLTAAARGGCALLVTGHEVDELLTVADEVVWMVAGTTHGLGGPEDARSHPQFRREYLGPRGGSLSP